MMQLQISFESPGFKRLVDEAKIRSGSKISYEECYKRITSESTSSMMEQLKKSLKNGDYALEELQDLIACLWVLYDLGRIRFPAEDVGIALSVQNLAKINKQELAARLLQFLERNITIVES